MSPGSYISVALHLGFVGWLVFNGDFSRKPSEMSVADVSVVSSEVFDIMVNNTSPDISTDIPNAEAVSVVEDAAGPSAPEVDAAPAQVAQSLAQIFPSDALAFAAAGPCRACARCCDLAARGAATSCGGGQRAKTSTNQLAAQATSGAKDCASRHQCA
jgi:hypothetical protein